MKIRRGIVVIEVIIFLVVLGLIGIVFVPAVVKIQENARVEAVEKQLNLLASAGKTYLQETQLKRVDYPTLVKKGVIQEPESVLGESYEHIILNNGGGVISVTTSLGKKIAVTY